MGFIYEEFWNIPRKKKRKNLNTVMIINLRNLNTNGRHGAGIIQSFMFSNSGKWKSKKKRSENDMNSPWNDTRVWSGTADAELSCTKSGLFLAERNKKNKLLVWVYTSIKQSLILPIFEKEKSCYLWKTKLIKRLLFFVLFKGNDSFFKPA